MNRVLVFFAGESFFFHILVELDFGDLSFLYTSEIVFVLFSVLPPLFVDILQYEQKMHKLGSCNKRCNCTNMSIFSGMSS